MKYVLGLIVSTMLFAFPSIASAQSITYCGGGAGGNYEYTGNVLKSQLNGIAEVNNINTKGSWENLEKLRSGECDAALVQSDALYLWNKTEGGLSLFNMERMFGEYVHLLCNRRSGVSQFSDLNENTKVYTGSHGSGSDVSLRGLIEADKEFGNSSYVNIPLLNEGGDVALVKLNGGQGACMVYTAGPGTTFMAKNAEKFSDNLVLVDVVDKDFNDVTITDANGSEMSVWNPVTMDDDTYGKIMPSGIFGNSDVDTIGVTAVFVVSSSLVERSPDLFAKIGIALPDIKNIVRADRNLVNFD